jgi:hypothetical protein
MCWMATWMEYIKGFLMQELIETLHGFARLY